MNDIGQRPAVCLLCDHDAEHNQLLTCDGTRPFPGAYTLHGDTLPLIIDSGASAHYIVRDMQMTDVQPCNKKLKAEVPVGALRISTTCASCKHPIMAVITQGDGSQPSGP